MYWSVCSKMLFICDELPAILRILSEETSKHMDYTEEFLKEIETYPKGPGYLSWAIGFYRPDEKTRLVRRLVIEDVIFYQKRIENYYFSGCKFKTCEMGYITFERCEFINCEFENCLLADCIFHDCTFESCLFMECMVLTAKFDNCYIRKTSFVRCNSLSEVDFLVGSIIDVLIFQCSLSRVRIANANRRYPVADSALQINESQLLWCVFQDVDLDNFCFEDVKIEICTFVNVLIGKETFKGVISNRSKHYSFIDLQSLCKSEIITASILKDIFGIHGLDIQSYIREMLLKIEFHTVFISYSFKDSEFAKLINNALLAKGVITFLWESDAPGGQRLKKIMYDRIQKFDKILFIASKNSLKSEACHFELSEGKKKYESTWEEVLFPIHIDDYLFKIQEHEIPRAHRNLFYDNILELREIHSKDFSKFLSVSINDPEFNEALIALIIDLRKKP